MVRLADLSSRPALTAFVLLVVLFILYNSNLRHGRGLDTIANTVLPISIIKEGNLEMEEFRSMLNNERGTLEAGFAFGALQEKDGVLISSYPIGAAVVAVPVFMVADLAGWLDGLHQFRVIAKVSSALICAATATILFLCLLQLTHFSAALVISLMFGAGTSMWAIVSQDLWQHGPGMLCLTLTIYCLLRMRDRSTVWLAALVGGSLALAVICRPLNAIPAVLFSAYILLTYRQRLPLLVACFVPAALLGGWLIYFNLTTYGNLMGGYDAIYQSQWHKAKNLDQLGYYTTPLGYGLASILVSPNKGMLIYSPYMVFGFVALCWVAIRQRTLLSVTLILWVLLTMLLLAKNVGWYGGTNFGSRYMSEALIPLSLLLGMAWPNMLSRIPVRLVFFVLALLSVSIQAIGAFRSPCGWAETPVYADFHPERHWDWSDMEIARCLRDGLIERETPWEMLNPPPPGEDF